MLPYRPEEQFVANAGRQRDEIAAGVEARVGSRHVYLEVAEAVAEHENGMVDAGVSEA